MFSCCSRRAAGLDPAPRLRSGRAGGGAWVDQLSLRTAGITPAETPSQAASEIRASPTRAIPSRLTRAIQRELKAKGYEAGAVDGVAGLVTRAAIMA